MFVVVGAAVLILLAGGVALVLRHPLQRLWFAGTGLQEWHATARQLPWQDRVSLARANTRGRATNPRLAGLAVRRGHVMMAVLSRMQYGRRSRWLYPAMTWLGVLLLLSNLAIALTAHHSGIAWYPVVAWGVLTPAYAVMPWIQRRRQHRIQRSVDLNARIAAFQAAGTRN